jgi:hypothetical protein
MWSLGGSASSVKTYERGRVCAVPGCTTSLSIYNPSACCALHERLSREPTHRRRFDENVERRCANDGCQVVFVATNPARRYCSDRCRIYAFQRRRRGAAC